MNLAGIAEERMKQEGEMPQSFFATNSCGRSKAVCVVAFEPPDPLRIFDNGDGGLFAFITSFDEVVVVLFVGSAGQKTLPWQMFTGLREQISPTILAVATILVAISIALLATLEFLRRRSERLRGMSPS